MEKLNVDSLFPPKEEYLKAKSEYIPEWEERIPGGFFSMGYYSRRPDVGEAEWDAVYPNGYTDWREQNLVLTYSDLKLVEQKINEIIDALPTPHSN